MAINFTNTGYINFNAKYNKKLQSGALTTSMSVSEKQQDGSFSNGYLHLLVPAKHVSKDLKADLKKKKDNQLWDVEGFMTMNGNYPNAVATSIKPHAPLDPHGKPINNGDTLDISDDDMPF